MYRLLATGRQICSQLKQYVYPSRNISLSARHHCLTLDAARNFTAGDSLHGFTVKRVDEVKELLLVSVLLEHEKTGAQYLHLARNDVNNTFSVLFRTTPKDDTGVSHILEHTTLCGSKKFPVHDPFFKMLSRTLANNMNAFTAPDATVYHYSTTNNQDFRNLMHVYLDAVFQPILCEKDFSQEGWRLEHRSPLDPNSPMTFRGVVFNEMKGKFSNSLYSYVMESMNNLLPSSTYSVVSAGRPMSILDLTIDNLRDFHKNYYHPTNSRFYSYGNFPLEPHLEFINQKYLSNYDRITIDSSVPFERRWTSPRQASITCPLDPMAPQQDHQTTVSVNYLLNNIVDVQETFTAELISHLLTEGETSPFYQSLLEQNIGSNYSPNTGYFKMLQEAIFSVGLGGIHKDKVSDVKAIIENTFSKVYESGFDQQRIESTLHKLELSTKHETAKYGLDILTSIAWLWNHGGNPADALQINSSIAKFREKLKDPRFLQEKVKEYFIDNSHRLTLTMSPDADYQQKIQKLEEEKLAARVSALTAADKKLIYDQGLSLQTLKEDRAAEAVCLPTLAISDVNKLVYKAPKTVIYMDDIPIQTCEQQTRDLVYFRAISNMASVPQELKLYIPLFCRLVTKMGAGLWDFRELSQNIDMYTGGLVADIHLLQDHTNLFAYEEGVLFSSVCAARNVEKMMELWVEVFNRPNFRDKERMMTLIKITAAELAQSVADNSHLYAITRASSTISPSGKYYENRKGITQVRLMKRVAELTDLTHLHQHLIEIAQHVLRKSNIRFAINGSEEYLDPAIGAISKFIGSMSSSKGQAGSHSILNEEPKFLPRHVQTHIKFPFTVNSVAKCIEGVPYTHADYANLRVLSKLIDRKFLHQELREKGGAYGSGANVQSGVIQLYSYRDPNVLKTLSVFDRSVDWVKGGNYTNQDIQGAILSIFQETDAPMEPGKKGDTMFKSRISDEMRQNRREQLFAVTRDGVIDVAERYLTPGKRVSSVAFLGPDNDEIKSSRDWVTIEETA